MAYQPKSYRKFLATGVATAVVATVAAPGALADQHSFTDVEEGTWFYDAVYFGVENNLFEGYEDGSFQPYESMTRAEAVTVLLRALEVEFPDTVDTTDYPDVAGGTWFSGAIQTASDMGLVEGKPDGDFHPNATLTRAELAQMVSRAFELDGNSDMDLPYEDLVAGAWYEDAIADLTSAGIVEGKGMNRFEPNTNVQRNEAATIYHRILDESVRLPVGDEGEEEPPATGELTFELSTNAEDNTLTADGADNTTVTIRAMRGGEVDTDFTGIVNFSSSQGATFARNNIAFDGGEASVQVTSLSSSQPVVDTITATLSETGDSELNGTSYQMNITYVPQDIRDQLDPLFVTSAESNRASDINVRFNTEIDFDQLYELFLLGRVDVNVTSDGQERVVHDIVQVDERTVRLVFLEDQALTDNAEVQVQVVDAERVQTSQRLFIDATASFNLVDAIAPEAVRLTTPEFNLLVSEFTEPITAEEATNPSNWVLNGQRLTEEHIRVLEVGKPEEQYMPPVRYDRSEGTDNRHFVSLRLTSEGLELLREGQRQNLLQASNMTDYAGLTDTTGQNVASTQEFIFQTPAAPPAPEVAFAKDSVEQFQVHFSEPVVAGDGSALINEPQLVSDISQITFERKVVEDGTTRWVDMSEDVNVRELYTPGHYIFELTRDWTEILDTENTRNNYFSPNHNEVRIKVETEDDDSNALVKGLFTDRAAEEAETKFTLTLDDESPTIDTAEQATVGGQLINAVDVEMSEPIQIPGMSTEVTPSQTQNQVPMPTFEFVNEDGSETVRGEVTYLSRDDKRFTVRPAEGQELAAGEWTIFIRSISDDVGNTSETTSSSLTIEAAGEVIGEPRVIWAGAIDNIDTNNDGRADTDRVVIQYGTEMSIDAIRSSIYNINGKQLPSGVSITSGEVNYTLDGVTLQGTRVVISMPNNFLGDSSETVVQEVVSPHILNISRDLTSEDGEAIMGSTQIPMSNFLFETASTAERDAALASYMGGEIVFPDPDEEEEEVLPATTFAGAGGNVVSIGIPGTFNLILDGTTAEYGDELTLLVDDGSEITVPYDADRGDFFLPGVQGYTQEQLEMAEIQMPEEEEEVELTSLDYSIVSPGLPGVFNVLVNSDGDEFGDTITLRFGDGREAVLNYDAEEERYAAFAIQNTTEEELEAGHVVLN